jgi:hypothetical protein
VPERRRWDCPTGEHPGVIAPARMRKEDIRRFCIPCSFRTGRLTERVAPSLLKQRIARASSRKRKETARAARETQREAGRWTFDSVDFRREHQPLIKLPVFRSVRASLAQFQLTIRRGAPAAIRRPLTPLDPDRYV